MARETERLTIGWGIISPFTRHPVQVAMDARVVQEAAGPGRFILGFGTSKIFLNNARMQTKKTLGPMRDAVEIVRGVLGGEAFEYEGDTWSASVPGLSAEADTPRDVPPVYVAATAPKMQALAGEIADGCLTPSITTPAFVRYTRENVDADIDIGCTVVASIDETDRDRGRDGAREIAGMYLANKVQNIQGCRRHAARPRRSRAGRDPPGRRGDGAGRPARGEGAGDATRSSTSASRSPARPPTASPRSRSTATPAARTSCSSCGARTGTSRSACSGSRSCRTSGDRLASDSSRTRWPRSRFRASPARRRRWRPGWRGSARSSGSPSSGSRSRTGGRTCSQRAPARAAGRR